MEILDGKKLSETLKEGLRQEISELTQSRKRPPHLAAVLVGNNGASETYVASKVQSCKKIGVESTLLRFPETISESELLETIQGLNQNESIDGILVQLPLPKHIDSNKIMHAIFPEKDVDGFHPQNIGKMALNEDGYLPATPFGILLLLKHYNIETSGKHCVIVGRSSIVGMPMSLLLSRNGYPGNCTVTLCHSKTKDLETFTRKADILIAALGRPNFITNDMVKEGAVVIDVGISRIEDTNSTKGYRILGDVDFENVAKKSSFITPVPGGVGPMTIVGLLTNTLKSYKAKTI